MLHAKYLRTHTQVAIWILQSVLSRQAGVELLDRKMATLRADISEKAAEAAKVYKFNAGAAHPTADSSPETVAAGEPVTLMTS